MRSSLPCWAAVSAASTSYPVASTVLARLEPTYRGGGRSGAGGADAGLHARPVPVPRCAGAAAGRARPRAVLAGLGPPAEADLRSRSRWHCWELSEREFQYFACDYLRRHARRAVAGFLDAVRPLVDHEVVVGHRRHAGRARGRPAGAPLARSWCPPWTHGRTDENLWLARTAILHQLAYKADTDADRLFGYCAGPGRPPGLLHPQGDRLGPAGVREDRSGRGAGLRRRVPRCLGCRGGRRSRTCDRSPTARTAITPLDTSAVVSRPRGPVSSRPTRLPPPASSSCQLADATNAPTTKST